MNNVKIKWRAVLLGTLVFIVIYCIHLLVLPWLSESFAKKENESVVFGVHQFLGIATCMASGYVAAVVSGEKGFFYGIGVGGLGTLISAIAAAVWSLVMDAPFPELERLPFWVMVNGFLAGFAGLLATFSYDADDGDTKGRKDRLPKSS